MLIVCSGAKNEKKKKKNTSPSNRNKRRDIFVANPKIRACGVATPLAKFLSTSLLRKQTQCARSPAIFISDVIQSTVSFHGRMVQHVTALPFGKIP